MKNALRTFYLFLVGPSYGFAGEGNSQWYYTIALAISIMLVWWLRPDIAVFFTVMAVIHYVTVFVYGYFDMEMEDRKYTIAYASVHLVLLIAALIVDWRWTILTCAIVVDMFFLAPNECGDILCIRRTKDDSYLPLLLNTIVFAIFVFVLVILPIAVWIKILIFVATLFLHPLVDILEGECVSIFGVTSSVIENLMDYYQDKKH